MVAQERPPPLAIAGRTYGTHVTLDGPFGHANAKLEKFSSDALRAPGAVVDRHATNAPNTVAREA
jgi:hypothetical protein